jgi:hypothetical protein
LTEQPVAEVHLGFDNEQEILMYQNRGRLLKKRYRVTETVKYLKALVRAGAIDIDLVRRVSADRT